MSKKTIITIFVTIFLFNVTSKASDTLRLNSAIAIALEKNFSIVLAEDNLKISENANTIGNAGMLPVVGLTGARSLAVNNSKQEYYDGRLREGKDAKTNTKSAGLQLTWTIFDGFNMFIQKDKFELLENMSSVQLRSVVENTVAAVINTYYNIVAQQALADVYKTSLRNTAERLGFSKSKYNLGSASELSVLQASVDLNADSAAYIKQLSIVENLKSDLNLLLCRETKSPFETEVEIPINSTLTLQTVLEKALSENPDLQKARKEVTLANYSVKESKSALYPRLSFNSGYSYSQSNSEVGIMTLNRNYGYNLGLSLSYTLFDGFTLRQQITQSKIKQESAITSAKKLELELKTNVNQVFNDYITNLKLVAFEAGNLELALKNYRIAEEKFKLGSLTDIELRETQVKYLEAENRLLSNQYLSKLAETELFRLAGILSVQN